MIVENKKIESIFLLTRDEIQTLLELSRKMITVVPSVEPNWFCIQAKELSLQLPERIKNKLLDFVQNGSECGFLLIQGIFETDFFVPFTPKTNNEKIGEKTDLAKIQGILIHALGEMISYEAEGHGDLFQDVIPMKMMEYEQTSVGSQTELEIHTEQAFSKLRPDILSLACLRGDPNAYTYFLPVHYLLNQLTCEEISLLRQPLWKTGVDLSFQLTGVEFIEGMSRGPMPILYGSQEDPLFIFDQDLMTGITDEAHSMIKKIVDIYYQYRIYHSLNSGEIIFIDNRRCVHGRSSFLPKYNGYDRFLTRCFATFDFESSQYARPDDGRMIAAKYS